MGFVRANSAGVPKIRPVNLPSKCRVAWSTLTKDREANCILDKKRKAMQAPPIDFDRVRTAFIGLDTEFTLADGQKARRIYLDSAASNLMSKVAHDVQLRALRHYANTHSHLHFGARLMTDLYHEAHEAVLDFVDASHDEYTAIFCGNGVTSALNRVAQLLASKRPERGTVITTMMEHHANDLPHRRHARKMVHIPLAWDDTGQVRAIDLSFLKRAIEAAGDDLNYVAITAASNVTGAVTPIDEVVALARAAGALVVVDAAQSAAHHPLSLGASAPSSEESADRAPDVVCLSGHKIYTPGSPGVIVARKHLFEGAEPHEVGGGIVSFVDADRFTVVDKLPDREETGTPNIPGAIGLGATLRMLMHVGMDRVAEEEQRLTAYAIDAVSRVPDVMVYGSPDLERIGVVTFNVMGLPHGLVSAILNDYFGIAVRNECFCAQPFVRSLLGIADASGRAPDSCLEPVCDPQAKPGMVRASLGLYNTEADIDALVKALHAIVAHRDTYVARYDAVFDGSGDYTHHTYRPLDSEWITLDRAVQEALV